jgi:hypothetical protein
MEGEAGRALSLARPDIAGWQERTGWSRQEQARLVTKLARVAGNLGQAKWGT